ncbi:MAG TPA: hypothetical protein VMB02_06955 [Candidatus Aquilonibacter sp.]|nr:hypothetical protein [Candidatus Aquilonibacter sp.]
MTFWSRASLVSVLAATFLLSSCSQLTALVAKAVLQKQSQGPDADRLLQVVHAYAGDAKLNGGASAKEQAANVPIDNGSEYGFEDDMALDLVRKDYDTLDKVAQDLRSTKARFKGGVWKLSDFYDGLTRPPEGEEANDDAWEAHIADLKAWIAARPESATARIALAETYSEYAFRARGNAYADSVSDGGWKLFSERTALDAAVLVDAAKLKEKCPYWFEAMQHVAVAQGWSKTQAKQLLDAAIAFEPTYYHYYRVYANFLLPRWYGDPGEVQAFAEQISDQIGGQQGKFMYFEIATVIVCGCDMPSDRAQLQVLSWPKIKDGYAALGSLYGYSNSKTNRFGYMAYIEQDRSAAQAAFSAIGDDWSQDVWESKLDFLNAKVWTEGQQGQ